MKIFESYSQIETELMLSSDKFDNYRDLTKKVDEKFALIHRNFSSKMQCGLGCYGCCKAGLSVSKVEAEYIKDFLNEREGLRKGLVEKSVDNPHKSELCAFLDERGSCLIYEARPVICRSHGAPILIPEDQLEDESENEGSEYGLSSEILGEGDKKKEPHIDVCPLNFKNEDLSTPEFSEARINLSLLNTLLSLINMKMFPADKGKRVALHPDAILSGEL